MVRRINHFPVEPVHAELTSEKIRTGIRRFRQRVEEIKAFEPDRIQDRFACPQLDAIEAAVSDSLALTYGTGTIEYERYKAAADWYRGRQNYAYEVPRHEIINSIAASKNKAVALLEQAVKSLEERLEDAEHGQAKHEAFISQAPAISRKIFIVHGHDGEARETIARYVAEIGFEPIILHEQANRGRTVIEKVEANSDVGFALVLLTPDDVGSEKGGELRARARQNVMLELGYFVGRLGRDRVCALKRGDLEIPTDFGGVVYTTFDDGGAWKISLGKELQAAGFEIDWNKLMGR